jgi:hypothetical protein
MRFLHQHAGQRQSSAKLRLDGPESDADARAEELLGLKAIEKEIAAAAGLLRPSHVASRGDMPPAAGPNLEELIRAVSKFEESQQSRVVDVFE